MAKFKFEMEEASPEGSVRKIIHTFETEDDTWVAVLPQMYNFLKGCGWLFSPSDELGVMKYDKSGVGKFISSEFDS